MMMNTHIRQRLGIYEEAVGTLSKIAQEDGFLIAGISGLNIVLPLEIEEKLAPLVGERVEFCIRIFWGKSTSSESLQKRSLLRLVR